jgi:hypothetical protein
MTLFQIILAELIRLYILGLLAMIVLGALGIVSWATVATATSAIQVALLPFTVGALLDFTFTLGRVSAKLSRRTWKAIHGYDLPPLSTLWRKEKADA